MMAFIFSILFATMPACAQEDSVNCAWNAHTQGNGKGHSFVALHKKGWKYDHLIYKNGKVELFRH